MKFENGTGSSLALLVNSTTMAMDEVEAAVIGDFVTVEAIEACEREYREQLSQNQLTDDVKFSYAWHLIKSQYKNDINKGIKLMGELITGGSDQRDYYYFMGLGHYKLEDYEPAERCMDRVLQMQPNNHQAQQLKRLITRKKTRDGLITAGVLGGAALLGGAAAVVGAVALIAFKARK